tara:strand:+ start:115 stop:507 length:393 start_codon:yes stop_codon:yes gene_type:complete
MLHLLIFSRFFFCGRRPKSEKKRKKKFKRTKQNFQKKNYNFFPAFFAAFFFKALTRIDDLRSKFSKKKNNHHQSRTTTTTARYHKTSIFPNKSHAIVVFKVPKRAKQRERERERERRPRLRRGAVSPNEL